ncbi:MAG: ABC transporter ATP-binding protein [Calditrichia bacterium]
MLKSQGLDWNLTKRLFPYIKRHKMLLIISLFFLILSDLLSVVHPYLFKLGIDNYVVKGDFEGLKRVTVILGAAFILMFASNFLFHYMVQYLGQKLLFSMRMDLFRKALSLSNDYFDKTPTGKVLTNITNDVEAIREFISNGVVTILGDTLKIAFIISAMFFINVKLAFFTFITIPLFLLATFFFRRSIRTGFRGVRKANSEINSEFVETINGIREIRLYNYQQNARERFNEKNSRYLRSYMKIVKTYAIYFPTIETVSTFSMIVILIAAHFLIGISLQVGVIFSFFAYLSMFFRPLRELAEQFNMFQSAMAAAERIFRLKDEPVSITNKSGARKIDSRLRGEVEFRNVTFSYDQEKTVLKNISFRLPEGETLALVGRTGSGKSTIIKLISRLYDIQEGSILVDGMDIRDLDIHDLRKQIAVIQQEPMVFSGNVYENIGLYDPAITKEQIEHAAKKVHAHEFIERLPQGYETPLLEGGKILSAGQKQLISLARAFLKDPAIVILDEATANIDSETEKLLEIGLKELFSGRSGIIIAHRLATIQNVKQILVLREGEIVESGNHEELLKLGKVYYKLYQTQSLLQEI